VYERTVGAEFNRAWTGEIRQALRIRWDDRSIYVESI
jgi:hypothetical protein